MKINLFSIFALFVIASCSNNVPVKECPEKHCPDPECPEQVSNTFSQITKEMDQRAIAQILERYPNTKVDELNVIRTEITSFPELPVISRVIVGIKGTLEIVQNEGEIIERVIDIYVVSFNENKEISEVEKGKQFMEANGRPSHLKIRSSKTFSTTIGPK